MVDYALLAGGPDKVLPLIYQFLGEPEYAHNFEQVKYDATDFDEALGLHGCQ